ncbi:hypoxanthine phosphoribosyltransferase [Desulfolithobacter dissulfuricans]|uniref:Hypoxanthine phosphoribosyltransferase n=1 Tax=Desulfolithobacter dissulfuricans TaxID=2795293 RepID=A0A915TXN6_9BACT|nr:hypoxanthine phosphoribosyltransferase [Desulfolithobacter dissulfuricans]BCO07653.1 hypoxanthine phosphoribosyltransferase [Desulfolithobacter dissulfuricans]
METRKLLLSSEQIQQRVAELGQQLTREYAGKKLVLMGVLNGAFMFLADLAKHIELDLEVDFIRVASYGNETSTSGTIRLTKEPELELVGKDILLVEDIIDTGTTMAWLERYFQDHAVRSVKVCALIDKKERRQTRVQVDYAAFHIDRGFLIGYGLDYAQLYRNLPAIYTLSP